MEIPEGAIVCKIDETEQTDLRAAENKVLAFAADYDSVARAVIDAREILSISFFQMTLKNDLGDYLSLFAYGCERPSRGLKRTRMDVDAMVKAWVPQIKKLALAHDIDEKDAASSALDELLSPIIAAPVSQLREFYKKLTAAMKADKEVPWSLWKLFDFWGTNVLDKITTEQELVLKKEIASRIAERSIAAVPPQDWVDSMIGALMWRAPEKLEEIEENLKSGAKPRVRGKESCLFLQVGNSEVML